MYKIVKKINAFQRQNTIPKINRNKYSNYDYRTYKYLKYLHLENI